MALASPSELGAVQRCAWSKDARKEVKFFTFHVRRKLVWCFVWRWLSFCDSTNHFSPTSLLLRIVCLACFKGLFRKSITGGLCLKDMSFLIICLPKDLAVWLLGQMFFQPSPAVCLPTMCCELKGFEIANQFNSSLQSWSDTSTYLFCIKDTIFTLRESKRRPLWDTKIQKPFTVNRNNLRQSATTFNPPPVNEGSLIMIAVQWRSLGPYVNVDVVWHTHPIKILFQTK